MKELQARDVKALLDGPYDRLAMRAAQVAEWGLARDCAAAEYARQARQAMRLLDGAEEMPNDIGELRL
jgi:hypothetical protein